MYPQPLIVSGLSIGEETHNVVYLATAATTFTPMTRIDATIIAPYSERELGNAGSRRTWTAAVRILQALSASSAHRRLIHLHRPYIWWQEQEHRWPLTINVLHA